MTDNNLYQVFESEDTEEYEHYAALDIGSNSFHLVVARVVQGALQVVNKIKHKVRLAEGLDNNQYLSPEYIDRGVQTLASMTPTLSGLHHTKVRVVATHTLRRAQNAKAFQRAAKKVFPYPIDIIAGAEEARLIYVGISSGLQVLQPRLIFDIGGGSTEFAIGTSFTPDICKSISMGCVTYQKRFFKSGIITQKACEQAITMARQDLELAVRSLNKHSWEVIFASSGTAKAIAQVIHPSDTGEPEEAVNQHDLQLLLARCIEKGHAEALDFEGLSEERKPVFASGLCIMLAIFQSLRIGEYKYAANALREGVLYELQPKQTTQNICLSTAQSMAKRYHVDPQYAHNVLQTCMALYNKVKDVWEIDSANNRFILGWASLLHEVGLHINSKGIHKHSSYILANSDMPGFHQEQQQVIATLVKFHRKRIKLKEFPEFVNYDRLRLYKLLAILRIALVFNINRTESIVTGNILARDDQNIELIIENSLLEQHPLLMVDLEKEQSYLVDINIDLDITVQ
ncbi:exopolyphosphatase [Glaciecola sp. 1036]|uniref:Ppx/GppA phosphatase family protein n=1 Tax=Alteromonadaceae TaxID=72275 RepID=UPI003CFBD7A7